MNPQAPRHHLSRVPLSGVGLPQDRHTRLAARRAFVNLKQTYLLAIEAAHSAQAEWLRRLVLGAEEPADLWLLRGAVFEALSSQSCRAERESLQHGIDSLFPRSGSNSGFAVLF